MVASIAINAVESMASKLTETMAMFRYVELCVRIKKFQFLSGLNKHEVRLTGKKIRTVS